MNTLQFSVAWPTECVLQVTWIDPVLNTKWMLNIESWKVLNADLKTEKINQKPGFCLYTAHAMTKCNWLGFSLQKLKKKLMPRVHLFLKYFEQFSDLYSNKCASSMLDSSDAES